MTLAGIPILLYHSIADDDGTFGPWTLPPARFEQHLDVIEAHGCTALTVTELVERVAASAPLPARPVVITFDDGFEDTATTAWPLLRARSLPATVYVTTGPLAMQSNWSQFEASGRRRMLTREQVAAMDDEGCEIGAHTVTHPQLDCRTESDARAEILDSKRDLEQCLGHPIRSFAYPHGFHDRRTRSLVIQSGFDSAAAVKNAMSHSRDDRYALARLTVTADWDAERLFRALAGIGVARATPHEHLRTKVYRELRRRRHVRTSSLLPGRTGPS